MKSLTGVRQRVTLWGRAIEIAQLEWDTNNTEHINKHNVTRLEVEESCLDQIYVDKTYESRFLLVGRTKAGRMVSIVLAHINKTTYYVVTARDSSRGERKKLMNKKK